MLIIETHLVTIGFDMMLGTDGNTLEIHQESMKLID